MVTIPSTRCTSRRSAAATTRVSRDPRRLMPDWINGAWASSVSSARSAGSKSPGSSSASCSRTDVQDDTPATSSHGYRTLVRSIGHSADRNPRSAALWTARTGPSTDAARRGAHCEADDAALAAGAPLDRLAERRSVFEGLSGLVGAALARDDDGPDGEFVQFMIDAGLAVTAVGGDRARALAGARDDPGHGGASCGASGGAQGQGVVQDHAGGGVENLADQQLGPSGGGANGTRAAPAIGRGTGTFSSSADRNLAAPLTGSDRPGGVPCVLRSAAASFSRWCSSPAASSPRRARRRPPGRRWTRSPAPAWPRRWRPSAPSPSTTTATAGRTCSSGTTTRAPGCSATKATAPTRGWPPPRGRSLTRSAG